MKRTLLLLALAGCATARPATERQKPIFVEVWAPW